MTLVPEAIRYFLKRHWRTHAALTALGLLVAMLEAANLVAVIPVMNFLVGTDGVRAGGALGTLVDGINATLASLSGGRDPFVVACAVFLALTLIKGGAALTYEYWVARESGLVLHAYRRELLERLRAQPLAFFAESRVGGIAYGLSYPPYMLAKLLYIIPRGAVDLFRFLSVLLVLFVVQPTVTLALAVAVALLYFAVVRRMGRHSYALAAERRDAEQAMNATATEWVHGIRPIRIAHADRHWIEGYETASVASQHAHTRLSLLLAAPRHIFELIAFGVFVGAVIAAYVFFPQAFRTQLAVIGVFALGLMRVLPSLAALARMPLDVRTTLPDVETLHRTLVETDADRRAGTQPYAGLREGVHIRGVTVDYPGRGSVLTGIDLDIRKGEVVAIVGPSGSGKSTLLNVVLGVAEPQHGSVTVDSTDIRALERGSYFSRMGYVGQDVLLFKGTIRENIAFFRPDVPDRDIRAAAVTAEIADFIESLPHGYDAPVGEGGVNLSGGQAQRIAIARAILHDPDILLLDEATSALDSASEAAVVHALEHAARNRTVIMVTHRLRSARWADTVVVLHEGRIVSRGSWDELLADPHGLFARMCREQQLTPEVLPALAGASGA